MKEAFRITMYTIAVTTLILVLIPGVIVEVYKAWKLERQKAKFQKALDKLRWGPLF